MQVPVSQTSFLAILLNISFVFRCASAFDGGPLIIHESIATPPPRFTRLGPASDDEDVTLRILLQPKDISALRDAVHIISTPSAERDGLSYGQHLSREESSSYSSPTPESISLAQEWLASYDVVPASIRNPRTWIDVVLPVSMANEMLASNFDVYTDSQSGRQVIRTLAYSIPSTLKSAIAAIHPTTMFPHPSKNVRRSSNRPRSLSDSMISGGLQTQNVTPSLLQQMYGIPSSPIRNPASVSLMVAEYDSTFFDTTDLNSFLTLYRPDVSPTASFTLLTVDNGINENFDAYATVEGCMDFEYSIGVATGVPVTMLQTGMTSFQEDYVTQFLHAAEFILNMTTPPSVVTTSFGLNEDEISIPLAQTLCNVYMQLGARGTSVIYSSGDGGVDGNQGSSSCDTETDGPFVSVFPATCPYVTSVGGTQLLPNTLIETGVNYTAYGWSPSGGFSTIFPRPSYQDDAIQPYLTSLAASSPSYAGRYNASGRGFPDVSMLAVDYDIVCSGATEEGGAAGTSVSAPAFAGLVALLNDQRISAGKPVLGFLNPLLYQIGSAGFTDILIGNNPGCNTTGFSATRGWDPVSGLGTPIFSQLSRAILAI